MYAGAFKDNMVLPGTVWIDNCLDSLSAQPGAVHWHSKHQLGVPVQRLWRRAGDSFMLRMLGRVGNESMATRFRSCILHPELGDAAVEAIRQINNSYLALGCPISEM